MKHLYFATSNKWKFEQAEEYFKQRGIELEQFEVELPESRSEDVQEIAREKADYAFKILGKPLFVIDAGFYIKALSGFPTTHVKFAEKYIGSAGVLKLMEGAVDRSFEFPNVVCYTDGIVVKEFVGTMKGSISVTIPSKKENLFGRFSDIQIPEGYLKTYAEFTEKDQIKYDENIWKPAVFDECINYLLQKK
jgi:XTP/dITP diphosphohydrolase